MKKMFDDQSENFCFDVGAWIQSDLELQLIYYSHLAPCGHPYNIRTAAKFQAKTNYGDLTEINSCYYRLALMCTLTRGPYSVHYNELELTVQPTTVKN